jgi:hypothetical protein
MNGVRMLPAAVAVVPRTLWYEERQKGHCPKESHSGKEPVQHCRRNKAVPEHLERQHGLLTGPLDSDEEYQERGARGGLEEAQPDSLLQVHVR